MSPSIITHSQSAGYKPPIVGELEAMFRILPDDELLARLRGPKRRGRPGYNPEILWRCYVACYALGLASVSDLVRLLHDNPHVAAACGINSLNQVPSQPTLSRFGSKLAKRPYSFAVRDIFRRLTLDLWQALPDFGRSVAIDSTDVRAWSNAGKKGRRGSSPIRRQRPKLGKVSDPDAGWIVKKNNDGNTKKWVWGFKVHILADTQYELPIAVDVSRGSLHDVKKASPLLRQARFAYQKFHPRYVICDAGYSSDALRHLIRRQYRAEPIIDPNPSHRRAVAKQATVPDWKVIYNRRSAIERLNGRLKAFRRLNSVRVRGQRKVRLHAMLSVIALQVRAVAFPDRLRECVLKNEGLD